MKKISSYFLMLILAIVLAATPVCAQGAWSGLIQLSPTLNGSHPEVIGFNNDLFIFYTTWQETPTGVRPRLNVVRTLSGGQMTGEQFVTGGIGVLGYSLQQFGNTHTVTMNTKGRISVYESNNAGANWSYITTVDKGDTSRYTNSYAGVLLPSGKLITTGSYNGIVGERTVVESYDRSNGYTVKQSITDAVAVAAAENGADIVIPTQMRGILMSNDSGQSYNLQHNNLDFIIGMEKVEGTAHPSRLVLTRHLSNASTGNKEIHVAISDDFGNTWPIQQKIVDKNADMASIKVASFNDRIMVVWKENNGYSVHSIQSVDGGQTWLPEQLVLAIPMGFPVSFNNVGDLSLMNMGGLFLLTTSVENGITGFPLGVFTLLN